MMSKLQRKLRSRTGASMILALLFLMFCSFVGSSVLVSATANAYRVKLYGEQQDFLDQRSAALLLSDELQVPEGQRFRLYSWNGGGPFEGKGIVGLPQSSNRFCVPVPSVVAGVHGLGECHDACLDWRHVVG